MTQKTQPSLETPRLILRPFAPSDAPDVQRLAGAPEVAATTLNVPHPYEDGMAEGFIAAITQDWEKGNAAVFAVTLRESRELVGCMGLGINARFAHAELGYWIGTPFWGQNYATEAARAVVGFGFQTLGLHRIFASHLARNPASGRVQEKIGMKVEGTFREHFFKNNVWHDAIYRGILRHEWPN